MCSGISLWFSFTFLKCLIILSLSLYVNLLSMYCWCSNLCPFKNYFFLLVRSVCIMGTRLYQLHAMLFANAVAVFSFPYQCLEVQKLQIFDDVVLSVCFIDFLLSRCHKCFLPFFPPSRSFIVLAFAFRSVIHFEILYLYVVWDIICRLLIWSKLFVGLFWDRGWR